MHAALVACSLYLSSRQLGGWDPSSGLLLPVSLVLGAMQEADAPQHAAQGNQGSEALRRDMFQLEQDFARTQRIRVRRACRCVIMRVHGESPCLLGLMRCLRV